MFSSRTNPIHSSANPVTRESTPDSEYQARIQLESNECDIDCNQCRRYRSGYAPLLSFLTDVVQDGEHNRVPGAVPKCRHGFGYAIRNQVPCR